MPGLVHKYDGEFVIENIGDLKENYEEFTDVKWNIEIGNFYASPANLTISVGDWVVWDSPVDGGGIHVIAGWSGEDSHYTTWYPGHANGPAILIYGGVQYGGQHVDGYGETENLDVTADKLSYRFTTEGSFYYSCLLHPATIYGTITVVGLGTKKVIKSVDSTGIIPISRVVPGPSSLRGRSSAYTPSKGGNPLDMGK